MTSGDMYSSFKFVKKCQQIAAGNPSHLPPKRWDGKGLNFRPTYPGGTGFWLASGQVRVRPSNYLSNKPDLQDLTRTCHFSTCSGARPGPGRPLPQWQPDRDSASPTPTLSVSGPAWRSLRLPRAARARPAPTLAAVRTGSLGTGALPGPQGERQVLPGPQWAGTEPALSLPELETHTVVRHCVIMIALVRHHQPCKLGFDTEVLPVLRLGVRKSTKSSLR
jgi:hypothetical protein